MDMYLYTHIPVKPNLGIDRRGKKQKENVGEVTFKSMFINMDQSGLRDLEHSEIQREFVLGMCQHNLVHICNYIHISTSQML